MTVDLISLLQHNEPLLLFTTLSLGVALGRLTIKGFLIGKTLGVLLVALLLGQLGFHLSHQTPLSVDQIGFMMFIFCMGIEAGPHFFSIMMQDGIRYILLTLVITATAIAITVAFTTLQFTGPGLSSGIFAGAMTSTPALFSAQDALRSSLVQLPNHVSAQTVLDNMGISYAFTYLVGLIVLNLAARYAPVWLRLDIDKEAKEIARARGLNDRTDEKTYLPIIRAYRVGPELSAWIGGRTLRETGIYPYTGCYVERIRRNGILANPDGDAVIQEGDEIALVGYPESHEKLDLSYRNGKEVFERDILDLEITTAEIIVTSTSIAGRHLSELNLTNKGCFLNRITRSQIEMPSRSNIILQKGDVLQVSGECQRVKNLAQKIGFIRVQTNQSNLAGFSLFAVLGLMFGAISLAFGKFEFALGNSVGLMFSGILLGYIQATHPMFGYIPSAALKFLKDLGLTLCMIGLGLRVGDGVFPYIQEHGGIVLLCGLLISTLPVIVGYIFGVFILKMNPVLLMGALTGARTCAPAMEIINESAGNGIPSLGYAGTYAFANVLLTISGSLMIILWL